MAMSGPVAGIRAFSWCCIRATVHNVSIRLDLKALTGVRQTVNVGLARSVVKNMAHCGARSLTTAPSQSTDAPNCSGRLNHFADGGDGVTYIETFAYEQHGRAPQMGSTHYDTTETLAMRKDASFPTARCSRGKAVASAPCSLGSPPLFLRKRFSAHCTRVCDAFTRS